ncbi:DUF1566 domain-containing protein [Ottowia sp.]|uniref:Lcl C-terminal domain-containing protein n=1 Tax=Ottowia sp. TaxID=1898956 RepID=UPI0039E71E4B
MPIALFALLVSRLARGAALTVALLAPAAWAAAPFIVNGDGTVTDESTGLVWDQCYVGQISNGCLFAASDPDTFTWTAAAGAALAANLSGYKGHNDWRLPNVNELQSLVKIDSATSPAIDTAVFPGTLPSVFWSSTTTAFAPGAAWGVSFSSDSDISAYSKTDSGSLHVRLVRDGQPFALFDALVASYTLTPSAGTGGALSPAIAQTVPAGNTQAFDVLPAEGYVLDTISGCGGILVGSTYTSLPAHEDCTVTATYQSTGGTDPTNPTGTGTVQAVPTLGQWALALLGLLLAALGLRGLRPGAGRQP